MANDILYRNRKLAGILITSSLTGPIVGSATLGIGINLQPDSSRPETAVSLAEIDTSPRLPFPPDSIGPILRSLATRYSDICASQSAAISDWTGRLAYRDQPVVLQDGNTTHTGTLQGLTRSEPSS